MPEQMTGAQAAAAQLRAEGVEVVLGIPGIHNMYLCDAILDQSAMRFITGRHEQGVTFAANGYTRACGRIAVPYVITGPGVTNSLTALVDAYADSVPMVLIASQADLRLLGKGAFHELKDQTALLAQVTKWNTRVEQVEEIPDAIRTAFVEAYNGRPGPTAIEIPLNVQTERGHVSVYASTRPERKKADAISVREAARRLSDARSPVVVVGSGAAWSDCADELERLITWLQAPCFVTLLAKGVISDDHPLNLGIWREPSGTARSLLAEADVGLVVGASLDEAETRAWTLPLPTNLIQIDTSPDVIGRNYAVSVALVGDAKAVLDQLLVELGQAVPGRPSPAARIAESKRQMANEAKTKLPWQYMSAIERALPRDAVVTNDASRANGWAAMYLKRFLPRTFNITSNVAALGYAFPAALGAKLAFPDRQAVAILGDGGYLFTVYSLATAVQYRLNVATLVFDNRSYGTIGESQLKHFGRTVGDELNNPNFAMLARAFGAHGVRAEDPDQIYYALMAAWQSDLPTVIEVPVPEELE